MLQNLWLDLVRPGPPLVVALLGALAGVVVGYTARRRRDRLALRYVVVAMAALKGTPDSRRDQAAALLLAAIGQPALRALYERAVGRSLLPAIGELLAVDSDRLVRAAAGREAAAASSPESGGEA